ncbi:LysR family transcriptional regulator [Serratia entomophila]|jgi:DNA-binding transcriptional LysR family regulator|uniref:LysR family transcriptional regulator n=1 Tax=Serratia entomophila TaxID=42906 RepID=A0ABY5CWA0_9GAMM|nr:LysR family transcriptional regulator [Serratia entomophila]USV01791.1 LysR family transcriptional regulator [Serratia entomophila]CAI0693418.1 Bacterial regulatory helix-turn-helix protein, lysR family [Serratia entomophila]CAI0793701.1 Bacterial regulatory helix-turn-helix protein, lysR family [Serratia entomophila]CAI0832795.1 Bacterial regulatory helix-turn-helix protein, lysR family [Serratia entomophila]CAI0861611.1 Bacterial regulatory helix-turn-helix protein, lysR family [Serratia 
MALTEEECATSRNTTPLDLETLRANGAWLSLFGGDEVIARQFITIARSGSLKQASRQFGVRVDKLRAELNKIETALGGKLLIRNKRVFELTPIGHQIYTLVYDALFSGPVLAPAAAVEQIKLSMPPLLLEGFLLRPLIAWLHKGAGKNVVAIDSRRQDEGEADIRIWLAQPGRRQCEPWAVSKRRLISLSFMPFIASSYASKLITPYCLEDLDDYMLIQFSGYQDYPTLDPWNRFISRRARSVMHVSSYELAAELVRWSGVIGLLPTGLPRFNSNLLPLPTLFDGAMMLDVWIGLTAEGERNPEVRRIFDLFERNIISAVRE